MQRLFAACSIRWIILVTKANITMSLPPQPSVFGWASVYSLFLKPLVIFSVLSSPLVSVVVFDRVVSR